MQAPRNVISTTVTGDWFARVKAANQTKPGPMFYTDDMGPLDAPEWIACGGVSTTPTGETIIVHSILR